MCQISGQLKLCTCDITDVEQLRNYWILSRPGKKQFHLVGETFPPAFIDEQLDRLNEKTILEMLNRSNCFDTELSIRKTIFWN